MCEETGGCGDYGVQAIILPGAPMDKILADVREELVSLGDDEVCVWEK